MSQTDAAHDTALPIDNSTARSVRCLQGPPTETKVCARCNRLGLDCEWTEPQKRGRKPKGLRDSFGVQHAPPVSVAPAAASLPLPPAPESPMDTLALLATSAAVPPMPLNPAVLPPPPPIQPLASTSKAPLPPIRLSGTIAYDPADSPSTVGEASPRPSLSLLEVAQAKEAALSRLATSPSTHAGASSHPQIEPLSREPDPVDLAVLSELEAMQLFNHFHATLNGYVILLDPFLHTVPFTRRTSSVLFTTMLAVSAKFFRPDLYMTLLSYAKQLIGRGIVDGKASVGLIQAILCLSYWKEPNDSSAWLRIGLAIRMGLQLHLHAQRSGPLPADEHEARLQIDRERLWAVLICFDHTYFLSVNDEDDGFHQTSMIPHYKFPVEAWLDETKSYGVEDDRELGAAFEWIKVLRLSKDIQRSRPSHARALAAHLDAMLDSTYERYLNPASPKYLGTHKRSLLKTTFFWYAASVALNRALLVAVGTNGVTVAKFMVAASGLVESFEACTKEGMVLYWQDTLATTMFNFGEFLVKIFHKTYTSNQTTILKWMESLYRVCELASGGHEYSTAAFISRFFQHSIRVLCAPVEPNGAAQEATPLPATSATASAEPAAAAEPAGAVTAPTPGQLDPLDPNLFNSMGGDSTYWQTLFPGEASDWSWLEQTADDVLRNIS
ncbi:hypothetical protein JCM10207_000044 [Rhodosporidiobolus poonsookiae]